MSQPKKLRGRPKKNINLFWVMDILETYERIKLSGLGRDAAISQTVADVFSRHPNEKISDTTVKNILVKFQPEDGFLFEHESQENWKRGVFRVKKVESPPDNMVLLAFPELAGKECTTLAFGHADRPDYGKRGMQKTKRKQYRYGNKKS